LLRLCARAPVPLYLCAFLLAGCRAGADHERLGDRRYAERAYPDALAEYRLASRTRAPSLELRAKLALAALHAGSLVEAAEAYRAMAAGDPTTAVEAADGLALVARRAAEARDVSALRSAVAALRTLAPGRLALLGGSLRPGLSGASDADLVLAAAAAGAAGTADSLLALWAELVGRAGRCDDASRAWAAVLRRNPTPALGRTARGGLAGCAVEVGREALAGGRLAAAESSFQAAVAIGVPDSIVRVAWLLTGDARWAGGDTIGAVSAYHKAMAGLADDHPVVQRAQEQLGRLLGERNPDQP
jgi:tetratricopeptide (TPR) repeat protein